MTIIGNVIANLVAKMCTIIIAGDKKLRSFLKDEEEKTTSSGESARTSTDTDRRERHHSRTDWTDTQTQTEESSCRKKGKVIRFWSFNSKNL